MPDGPPYLAIAAALRDQITSGALGPGDKVPSTRQLAGHWGVAMATAAKALTLLRQEGVVEARPRSGTVVAPVRPTAPASPPDGEPSRERVLSAAIRLADADGLAAVSMRAVAAEIGVAPMTLYRHVRDKDDLLAAMSDAAFAELPPPDDPPSDSRALLELAARRLWEIHKRHPWLAHVTPLNRPMVLPNLLVYSELMLSAAALERLGPGDAYDHVVLLYNYVLGVARNIDAERRAATSTGLSDEQWVAAQQPRIAALVGTGRFPRFQAVFADLDEHGYDLDLDRIFELGLRHLLDGITGAPVSPPPGC